MIALDFLLGYLSSAVPLHVLSTAQVVNIKSNRSIANFDYIGAIQHSPILFAIANVVIMLIVDEVYRANNYNTSHKFILAGIIAGVVYSVLGGFYMKIPEKVLNMDNPIMFNVYALFTWVLVYFALFWLRDNIMSNC